MDAGSPTPEKKGLTNLDHRTASHKQPFCFLRFPASQSSGSCWGFRLTLAFSWAFSPSSSDTCRARPLEAPWPWAAAAAAAAAARSALWALQRHVGAG